MLPESLEANGLVYSRCPANTNDLATPLPLMLNGCRDGAWYISITFNILYLVCIPVDIPSLYWFPRKRSCLMLVPFRNGVISLVSSDQCFGNEI